MAHLTGTTLATDVVSIDLARSSTLLTVFNEGTDPMRVTLEGSTPSATVGIPIEEGGAWEHQGAYVSTIRIWCATAQPWQVVVY